LVEVRYSATARVNPGRNSHRKQGGIGVNAGFRASGKQMRVEIYESRKHQTAVGIDGSLRLHGFAVPGSIDNFVSPNQHFAETIDASFRVDDGSADDSQINFHVSAPPN
jgi:hypothetical protein